MVAETYISSCAGHTEYGWTIKESHDHDDSVHDIVLGAVSCETPDDEAKTEIEAAWEATRAAANAFASALPDREETDGEG